VRIQAEDVSVQDVAAPVLARVTFPADVGVRELGPFTVEFPRPPAGHAAVRVHIDQNGDGRVRVGDLVSVARHNAPSGNAAVTLMIPVQVVTG
jgi:hypothetical protein